MSLITTIQITNNPALTKDIDSREFDLHDSLSDDADWNAAYWIFDDEKLADYCHRLTNLFNSTEEGFTFESIWAGDKVEETKEVSINELVRFIQENKLGTKTRYIVHKNA